MHPAELFKTDWTLALGGSLTVLADIVSQVRALADYDMAEIDRQLKLEIIWKDDYMIEVRAFASNGRYSGTTEVYTGCEDLLELSNNLKNFPKTLTDTVSFEAGERSISPFLSLRFYCFDGSGHTAVEVSMEENVPTNIARRKNTRSDLSCNMKQAQSMFFRKRSLIWLQTKSALLLCSRTVNK